MCGDIEEHCPGDTLRECGVLACDTLKIGDNYDMCVIRTCVTVSSVILYWVWGICVCVCSCLYVP